MDPFRTTLDFLIFLLKNEHFPTEAQSTARVSSRKYFIPGCVGRGLDLDLRIRPAAPAPPAPAPAASGNPGLRPLGILGVAQKS